MNEHKHGMSDITRNNIRKILMAKSPTWLLNHSRNVYSQNGEDGIIEKILDMLPNRDRWCVEFGAWNGIYLTNTRNLIIEKGYSAVLNEADPDLFIDLQ